MHPYAPPEESRSTDSRLAVVVGAWAMAGASLGTAVGATLQLIGVLEGVIAVGLGSALVLGGLGLLAHTVERRASSRRPEVVDGRGRLVRPLQAWLLGVPLVVIVVGFLGLVVIGTVRAESLAPGLLFLVVAVGVAWLTRPLVVSHRLRAGLEAAESGRRSEARQRLLAVESGWITTRSGRAQARLNLGLLALQDGDLEGAARWYSMPSRGRVRAFTQTGLALCHALSGRWEPAERALGRAVSGGAGRAIQGEVDAVRLLVVLGRDGPEEAAELGERLSGPGAGALFLGVLAVARSRMGDPRGAEALLDDRVRARLLASGLAVNLPELEALLQHAGVGDLEDEE